MKSPPAIQTIPSWDALSAALEKLVSDAPTAYLAGKLDAQCSRLSSTEAYFFGAAGWLQEQARIERMAVVNNNDFMDGIQDLNVVFLAAAAQHLSLKEWPILEISHFQVDLVEAPFEITFFEMHQQILCSTHVLSF
jgi:hypothetical protein